MAIGDRIKLARSAAGLNQRELADAADVSAMAISKYERGLIVPSSGVLIRLAKVLHVRTEYFLRPIQVSLSVTHYRCHPSFSEKQKEVIRANAQEWLERYMEVEDLFGGPLPFSLPAGVERRVESLDDIEGVALALRDGWEIGRDAIESVTETLEDRGIKIGLIDGDKDFDAFTLKVNDEAPAIALKRGLPGDRQRFTLAHELAHWILNPSPDIEIEKAANRFAGAFLVPEPTVRFELGSSERRTLNIAELYSLKHKYGMSMQAWIHRAEELRILPKTEADNLFAAFRLLDWKEHEPDEQVPQEAPPQRMTRMVMRALAEDMISESRAAELLSVPLPEFHKSRAEGYVGVLADAHR